MDRNLRLPGMGRALEETKRISRIVDITHRIAVNPRRFLRRDLAAEFEVSERMIQKDLDIIRHGLRLHLEHTPQGYFFEQSPRLPALALSFAEALALLLAIRTAQQVSGVCSADLKAAVARVEALFPPEFAIALRHAAQSGQNSSVSGDHRRRMLDLLHSALLSYRKVRISYQTGSRGGAATERVVRPYHIMPHVRSWHLIGHCELRGEVRLFKVDRIDRAELTDEHYRVPEAFNVEEYLGESWGVIRREGTESEEVVVHFDDEAGRWVSEEFWHRSQRCDPHPEGGILFHVRVPVTPEFVNWLLYYGPRAEVIEPAWLRERVAEEHRKAAELNAGRASEVG